LGPSPRFWSVSAKLFGSQLDQEKYYSSIFLLLEIQQGTFNSAFQLTLINKAIISTEMGETEIFGQSGPSQIQEFSI